MRSDAEIEVLLGRYDDAPTVAEAEAALAELEPAVAQLRARDVLLGDMYDELATIAVDDGDPLAGARLQARAVALGCTYERSARAMLAWYQLISGQAVAGEAGFAALIAEDPDDPDLYIQLGLARSEAGVGDVLAAYDEALAIAKRVHDAELLRQAQAEREHERGRRGLAPDADDLAARAVRSRAVKRSGGAPRESVAWLPPEAFAELAEHGVVQGGHAEHSVAVERRARHAATADGVRPRVIAVAAADVLAVEDGVDGDDRVSRAAAGARDDALVPWPPARNEPCWCGSERKYKRCCGTV